jgi:hypothetical protein
VQIDLGFGPAEEDFPSFEGSSFQKWEKASEEDEGELAVAAVAAVVVFVEVESVESAHSLEVGWIGQSDVQSIQIP